MACNAAIQVLGAFSSDDAHAAALVTPTRFDNASGEAKHALIHIAVAQVLPDEWGMHADAVERRGVGLEKLEQWASCAASNGADVVVFPEYFLSGATHELWRQVRHPHAQPRLVATMCVDDAPNHAQAKRVEVGWRESVWIDVVMHVATKYDIDIVAGTVVELGTQPHAQLLAHHPVSHKHNERHQHNQCHNIPHRPQNNAEADAEQQDVENQLFNTSYYISRQGQVLHRYTKQNLWHPERQTLLHSQQHTHPEQHHGRSTFIIQTKRGTRLRAAMAICWDLAWYSRFHQMISPPFDPQVSDLDKHGQAPGPDIIFVPTCWYASDGGPKALLWNGVGEAQLLDALCLTRAVELESLLVMCNVAGPYLDPNAIQQLREQLRNQHTHRVADHELQIPLIGLGRSRICAPLLNVVAEVPDQREAMLLQSVNLNLLRDARELYRMRYDHAQR